MLEPELPLLRDPPGARWEHLETALEEMGAVIEEAPSDSRYKVVRLGYAECVVPAPAGHSILPPTAIGRLVNDLAIPLGKLEAGVLSVIERKAKR